MSLLVVGCADTAAVLRAAGITDVVLVDREVTSSVFDDGTDTWTLTTRGGETFRGRVVIAGSPFVPWIPDLKGRNGCRGAAFHAAAPDTDFDPVGKHVAVIGADASAGWLIERLTASAASVTVFPHPPRRATSTNRRRWRRHGPSAHLVTSPIDTITASGIRTCDGIHHDTDAIVYCTGFALPDRDESLVGARGLSLQQAWRNGMEPYLGVAIHGFPNYFLITGPDSVRYIVACLQLMTRTGSSRIEVRRSAQHVFNERVHLHRPRPRPKASAFELSSSGTAHDNVYDGPATLTMGDTRRQVRVRLTGHVDPIDGQYHWQGMIFDALPTAIVNQSRAVTLAVGEHSAPARITEQTPQGGHSIVGIGAPPFALHDVELTVAQL